MINFELLKGKKNPKQILDIIRHNQRFRIEHPEYFEPEGLLVFCGYQGSGKTLSAVQYCRKVIREYPDCLFCTNVKINGLPEEFQSHIIEYDGLDSIKNLENGYAGVLYLIDEIHLEFNSLESKNIPIEVMIEVSQQRKQRKHIVGTSQVYMRMAKPLREQIKNIVICENYLRILQKNVLLDGDKTTEEDGKIITESLKTFWWLHSADLYDSYDTYAKMKRYRKEWQGRSIQ